MIMVPPSRARRCQPDAVTIQTERQTTQTRRLEHTFPKLAEQI